MFATLLVTLVTPFMFGNLDNSHRYSTVRVHGSELSSVLAAREFVSDGSQCHFLDKPTVTPYPFGRTVRPHWNRQHTIESFGPVKFNGMQFTNTSKSQWFSVIAHIFNDCH